MTNYEDQTFWVQKVIANQIQTIRMDLGYQDYKKLKNGIWTEDYHHHHPLLKNDLRAS